MSNRIYKGRERGKKIKLTLKQLLYDRFHILVSNRISKTGGLLVLFGYEKKKIAGFNSFGCNNCVKKMVSIKYNLHLEHSRLQAWQ